MAILPGKDKVSGTRPDAEGLGPDLTDGMGRSVTSRELIKVDKALETEAGERAQEAGLAEDQAQGLPETSETSATSVSTRPDDKDEEDKRGEDASVTDYAKNLEALLRGDLKIDGTNASEITDAVNKQTK